MLTMLHHWRKANGCFEEGWPCSFYEPQHHEVVTLAISKKHFKVGSTNICDRNLIFSRVLGLSQARELSLKDVLCYKLAPTSSSMFEDNGEMRLTETKSVLKRSLQVEVSDRLCQTLEFLVLDGCAISYGW